MATGWKSRVLWFVLVSASATAAAQDADPNLREYTFEDDGVFGDLRRPDGELIRARTRPLRESLVRARSQFIQELLESARDL